MFKKPNNLLDGSLIVFIISWFIMKSKLKKKIDKQVKTIEDNYMLFLLVLWYIIRIYFYFIIISLVLILLMLVFKMLILNQFAKMMNGKYLVSVEEISKSIMYVFTSDYHIFFNCVVFVAIVVYAFITICFFYNDKDKTDNIIKVTNTLDMILYIYAVFYIIWICCSLVIFDMKLSIKEILFLLSIITILIYKTLYKRIIKPEPNNK
jgi:hypothetical protein